MLTPFQYVFNTFKGHIKHKDFSYKTRKLSVFKKKKIEKLSGFDGGLG